ncbi:MAG: hypothetical protein K6E16_09735 [Lachnospiraceae bacterium]|nr:hypothetical protein [Lachnospiraceae bacterium]
MNRNDFLVLDEDNHKEYYGGNQAWFARNTQAHSGCGHIAALNSYLMLTHRFPIDKSAYTKYMNEMYRTMKAFEMPILRRIYDMNKDLKIFRFLKPSYGQNSLGFILGMLRFARKHGLALKSRFRLTFLCSYEKGLRFIKKGLKENGAVTLLTARNHHPLTLYSDLTSASSDPRPAGKEMRNHFVTITGIDESGEKVRLLVSTWGRIASIDYDDLVRSWHTLGALQSAMYYFSPKSVILRP